MCGRFTVTTKDTKKIADRFQVELEKALERNAAGEAPPPAKERAKKVEAGLGRFNVAPTQEVLTVRSSPDPEEAAQGEREMRLLRWGLVPALGEGQEGRLQDDQREVREPHEEPAYGGLVGKCHHRCLIVADGFYEWMKAEDPKQPRQPWRFTVDGGEPFAFAGICTRKEWEDDEDRGVEDGWLYSCTIVTTTPNAVVSKVHDRMPVILPGAEAEAAWLRPGLERRGRGGDVRPARRRADVERSRQPEGQQGRQRHGGGPGAARRALGRIGALIRRSVRGNGGPSRPRFPRSPSPALVVRSQEIATEGILVDFQIVVKGRTRVSAAGPGGGTSASARSRCCRSGHSSLIPCSVAKRVGDVFGSSSARPVAVRG